MESGGIGSQSVLIKERFNCSIKRT